MYVIGVQVGRKCDLSMSTIKFVKWFTNKPRLKIDDRSAITKLSVMLNVLHVILLILRPLGSQQSKLVSAYFWQSGEVDEPCVLSSASVSVSWPTLSS